MQKKFQEPIKPEKMEHVIVYRKDDEYAGWPFNGGFWHFGNGELVVGFNRNKCLYKTPQDITHRNIQLGNGQVVTLRSKDAGQTWPIEGLQILIRSKAELRAKLQYFSIDQSIFPKPKPTNFSDPDVAMATEPPLGTEKGPTAYFITRNRGYRWEGPFLLYDPVFEWIQARPSYVLRSDGLLLFFVQGTRWDESPSEVYRHSPEGRPFVYASDDGAVTWNFLSYITPPNVEPPKICPQPAILPDGDIVVALRNLWKDYRFHWTEVYRSEDGGLTWNFLSRVNEWGAPAHLLPLKDDRLLCTYGRRVPPYGIRARISDDGGETWGREIILRDGGGSSDLGYPRTALLPDGKVIAVYYFNRADDKIYCRGGVRHIAATIFEVPY